MATNQTTMKRQAGATTQFLQFALGGQYYAFPILKVREILTAQGIKPLPGSASRILGTLDLRGDLIPVLDLRLCVGLPHREPDARTCVLVMILDSAHGGSGLVGMLIDRVPEAVPIEKEQIQAPPQFGASCSTDSADGVVQLNGRPVTLLNLDRVIEKCIPQGFGIGETGVSA